MLNLDLQVADHHSVSSLRLTDHNVSHKRLGSSATLALPIPYLIGIVSAVTLMHWQATGTLQPPAGTPYLRSNNRSPDITSRE